MSVETNLPLVQQALWKRLGTRKHLQPGGLLQKLADQTGLHVNEVRRVMARLREIDWVEGVTGAGEPFARVVIKVPKPAPPDPDSLIAWREALEQVGLDEAAQAPLLAAHTALVGMSTKDLVVLAQALLALRDSPPQHCSNAQFLVSASHLMGSSKLLGQIPPSVRQAISPELIGLREQIPYVVTAGPENPKAIILIENPWAFELAVESGVADLYGLIATFGYGLSRDSEAFGRQLAGLLETRGGDLVQLRRYGDPPPIGRMLTHRKISFWGDLDPEGLRIYRRLKSRIPQLTLSELYEPMLARLQRGRGHPYVEATGKTTQKPIGLHEFKDDQYASFLAAACSSRGIDQECLGAEDLNRVLRDS